MEFEVLGWGPDGPTLRLDHEEFAYAGKFVMSRTGKTVARDDDELVGAVATSLDRTDPSTVHVRYVTVRTDRRGEGIGPRLLRFTAERALDEAYTDVGIAVNNPFAFEAASRAGFRYTGNATGIAELRMVYAPDERSTDSYQAGLSAFRDRDLELSTAETTFLKTYSGAEPPPVVRDPA